ALGEVQGQRILLPRAAAARAVLPQELQALGAQVDEVAVYRTIQPQRVRVEELRERLKAGEINLITFTSSSTVRNFVVLFPGEDLRTLLGPARVGCIGPITADTAREYGLEVVVQPTTYTIPAFAQAIVTYFQKSNQ